MTKTNFLLSLVSLTITLSCNNIKNKDIEEVELFQFPKITDKLESSDLELTSETWINYGDHHPYYFGKLSDTISLERYLRPRTPPPPPGTNISEWKPKLRKRKFDKYFIDWLDSREFTSRDTVNLIIKIDTTQNINNNGRKAFPVIIQNKSIDTIYIGYGNQIPIITEAKSKNGQWKSIEEKFSYMCGNGLHSIILPPNELVLTSELIYSGNFKTKLRIKMGNNYSEEFYGEINETQFESEWDINGNRKKLTSTKLPEYVGGNQKFKSYLKNKISLDSLKGKVYCSFKVDKTGKIKDIKLRSSFNNEIEGKIKNALKSMPNWKPKEENGKIVESLVTLPLIFK